MLRAAGPSQKSPFSAQSRGSCRPQCLQWGPRSTRRGPWGPASPTLPVPAPAPVCQRGRQKSDALGAGDRCHSKSPFLSRTPTGFQCPISARPEESGGSKVFVAVPAALPPTAPLCQTAAPVIALRGGCAPAFPSPNLITTCFLPNYNAHIIEELKATVAGRLVAVSFLLRWPRYNFASF